jgi:hypothetical protein
MADFSAFSPRYNTDYFNDFKEKVNSCVALVCPGEETATLKIITARLYAQTDRLGELVNHLAICFRMARAEICLRAADTGITVLRNRIRRRDIEGVLQNLCLVIGNVQKYGDALRKRGLIDAMIEEMNTIHAFLREEYRKRDDIVSNRKRIVQDNLHILNSLHTQVLKLCVVGRVLYMGRDTVKMQEYNFRNLVKKVRNVRKPAGQEEK